MTREERKGAESTLNKNDSGWLAMMVCRGSLRIFLSFFFFLFLFFFFFLSER